MKSRGVPAPAEDSTTKEMSEEREGLTPLDRPLPAVFHGLGADTVVSIEREVVPGHAYAILVPS